MGPLSPPLSALARRLRRWLIASSLLLLAGLTLALNSGLQRDKILQSADSLYGAEGRGRVEDWLLWLDKPAPADDALLLAYVNDYFNQHLIFEEDQLVWKQADFWASPIDSLGRHFGDCEDFSIGKYLSLILLGMRHDKLRMTYVRADVDGINRAHMVLAYYAQPASEPLILDNLNTDILPAGRRGDLHPVYSFNHDGLWAGVVANKPPDGTVAKLSRWRELLDRMQGEGLQYSTAAGDAARENKP